MSVAEISTFGASFLARNATSQHTLFIQHTFSLSNKLAPRNLINDWHRPQWSAANPLDADSAAQQCLGWAD